MDDTIKIIIGTISGFIVAFFAEPVKIYFQNRSRKENIRSAIYGEMFHNYIILKTFVNDIENNDDLEKFAKFSKYSIRTECHKFALTQETALFYQLNESTPINGMYAYLSGILGFLTEEKTQKQFDPEQLGQEYIELFRSGIDAGIINKKVLQKTIGDKTFKIFFGSKK